MSMIEDSTKNCGNCGRSFAKAHRTYLGKSYCGSCYASHFAPSRCTSCGRSSRILKSEEPHPCPVCTRKARWENKPCVRCKRKIKIFGVETDDGRLFCMSCRPFAHPPRLCPGCNRLRHRLTRDPLRGVTEPVCGSCLYRLGKSRCCAGCRRPRNIAGERDGKGYCAICLPTGAPPIITCIDCGKHKFHFGSGRCEDCAWARTHSRLLNELLHAIPAFWARELLTEYYRALKDQVQHGAISQSLRRDVPFFVALSSHFDSADSLSGVMIIRRLGQSVVKSYGRVMSFLNAAGYITTYADPDYELEWHLSRIRTYTARGPAWSHAPVERFLNHMLNKRDLALDRGKRRRIPTKPKSLESAVRAAIDFLAFTESEGVTSLHEVNQDHLDLFLGRNRSYRVRIMAFVRYVRRNERTFQKLEGPQVNVEFSLQNVMQEEERLKLIDVLDQARAVPDLRCAILAMFALIYAQPPHRSVAMKLNTIRRGEDGVHEVRFAKVWITLDEVTNDLVERWLGTRRENSCFERDNESEYLFPGRQAGSHMRAGTLGRWLSSKGTTVRSLMTTSLVKWTTSDIASSRILVDAFGVSKITAAIYCKRLGVVTGEYAKHNSETRS